MSIALGGSSLVRPTPKFKLQYAGSVIPGYCQSLDDPIRMKLSANSVSGRDGDILAHHGAESRRVAASMRILTRLDHADGVAHLNDCLEQYRDALAIVARSPNGGSLYLGDSDRYLPQALFESASLPLAAPDHRAVTFTLSFHSDSWYHSTTSRSVSRGGIKVSRLSGTANGGVTYGTAHFSGSNGILCNSSSEYVSLPPEDSLSVTSGSVTMWIRPQFANTNNTTSHILMRASGSTHFVDVKWQHTTQRFVVSGNATAGGDQTIFATAPSITFASGAHVFVGTAWDNTGTAIYVAPSGSVLSTSSSANPMFTDVGVPSLWHIGGTTNGYSNSVLSDLVTFRTRMTSDQMNYLASGSSAYDPFDTSLPTSMLLDHPFNVTLIANSSSNSLYLDVPASRSVSPVVTLGGGTVITMSGSETGKVLAYSGSASPTVTVDCGSLTAIDTNGTSRINRITNVNFDMAFDGGQRIGLLTTNVAGSFDATLTVTPEYER